MTIDAAAIIAGIAALGGLVLLVYRSLVTGAVHPRNLVPREDYEALMEINASYPAQIAAAAQAIRDLTDMLRTEHTKNGRP